MCKLFLVTSTEPNQVLALINDTKLYVLVVILSTQNNVKLFKQLKSDFKRTVNWDKCQSEKAMHAQNRYLDHFIILKSWMANRSKTI